MIPTRRKTPSIQLALFDELPPIPLWKDLDEPTRAEAARLLAHLLVTAQSSRLSRTAPSQEGRDE